MQWLIVVLFVILVVAFFSLYERKVLGCMQYRVGPSNVSLGGVLQPMADALKLVSKEEDSPQLSHSLIYWVSPLVGFLVSLLVWSTLPVSWGLVSLSMSMIILLMYFSWTVYGVMMMGWFSNSKYSILGCVRASAQSISYEIPLTIGVLYICLLSGSYSMSSLVSMQEKVWVIFPCFYILWVVFLSIVAESNRTPFDSSEAESELVSGFCIEYGGVSYTLVFLSENLALVWVSILISVMFTGGSKTVWVTIIILFVWVRASVPRIRFDKIMSTLWYSVLPVVIALFCSYSSVWCWESL